MSIWAGIKHALNSTLGKSDFKPLDEIVKNNASFIRGDTELVCNDFTIYPQFNNRLYLFEPRIAGELTLKLKATDPFIQYMWSGTIYIEQLTDGNALIERDVSSTGEDISVSFFIYQEDIGKEIGIYLYNVMTHSQEIELPLEMVLCADVIAHAQPIEILYP